MAGKLRLWSGRRSEGAELDRRLRQTLDITRPEGYRMVRDPWGEWVKVELARVHTYVVEHRDDPTRWRLVPLIIPTIKLATDRYEKGRGRAYEARLQVIHPKGPYERTVFVKTVVDVTPNYLFASILSPYDSERPDRTEKALKRERKKAGRRSRTRPNPGARLPRGSGTPARKVGRRSPPGGSSHA